MRRVALDTVPWKRRNSHCDIPAWKTFSGNFLIDLFNITFMHFMSRRCLKNLIIAYFKTISGHISKLLLRSSSFGLSLILLLHPYTDFFESNNLLPGNQVLLHIVRGVTNCHIKSKYTKNHQTISKGCQPISFNIFNFLIYCDKNDMQPCSSL